MPELPEVETIKEALKKELQNKTIEKVNVYYASIINGDIESFKEKCEHQKIIDLKRRGKWLLFELQDYYLLSHLRMEGKYIFREETDKIGKHEHVTFLLNDGRELRYQDTRKFGRMYLLEKENLEEQEPLKSLGLEPWEMTSTYLKDKLKKKTVPIKTALLEQKIVAGIGNIYDDEILFLSKINPKKVSNKLTKKECETIIEKTKEVLEKAIQMGGTTIRSYESSEGVHGRFQQELSIHGKEYCPVCSTKVTKIFIGGRGTYYCSKCQKEKRH